MSPIQELVVLAIAIVVGVSLLASGVAYVVYRQNKRNYPDGWPPDKRDAQ